MSGKRALRARMQGNLDGLCGVYSVVNASLHLSRKRLTADQTKELFRSLCDQLGREGRLEDTIVDGMTVRTLGRLIDTSASFLAAEGCGRIRRKMACKTTYGLKEFWDRIVAHIETNGDGSVILGMGGMYDHWTCVREIDENRISLIDSDGLHRLRRTNCTVGERRKGRHHVLWPTQTFLLDAVD